MENLKDLKPKCLAIWFTGLPCSGKTTIAKKLFDLLNNEGYLVRIFDGDEIRRTLSRDLTFTRDDRVKNALRVAQMVKEFLKTPLENNCPVKIALCALITPYAEIRKKMRELLDKYYVEVFVDCPLEVCEKRDTKGLYKLARSGQIKNFTGIDDPYEPPTSPEIHLRSDKISPDEAAQLIYAYLKKTLKP